MYKIDILLTSSCTIEKNVNTILTLNIIIFLSIGKNINFFIQFWNNKLGDIIYNQ